MSADEWSGLERPHSDGIEKRFDFFDIDQLWTYGLDFTPLNWGRKNCAEGQSGREEIRAGGTKWTGSNGWMTKLVTFTSNF